VLRVLAIAYRRPLRGRRACQVEPGSGGSCGAPPGPRPKAARPAGGLGRPRPPAPPAVVPLDPAVTQYAQACERILHTSAGKPVRDWLENRGIGPDVARANHVGADPGRTRFHRRRGLPYGATIAATFPALDQAGTIRYVQARYLDPPDSGDKYDNPARNLGTNPRIHWAARVGLPRPGLLVVTEGIPDALTAAQAGYTTAAILGSQAPDATVAARLATRAHRDALHTREPRCSQLVSPTVPERE
jgi:hypothetical protein